MNDFWKNKALHFTFILCLYSIIAIILGFTLIDCFSVALIFSLGYWVAPHNERKNKKTNTRREK